MLSRHLWGGDKYPVCLGRIQGPVATLRVFLQACNCFIYVICWRIENTWFRVDVIGEIRAIFQSLGKLDVAIQRFIICVKGPDICTLASFKNFTGIWSIPVDVSERSLSISFSASIRETQRRLKGCEVRGHSEKEFTRSIRSDLLSGLAPSVLSFVLKKNVLSLSWSACRGLGLGWRMRSITLHTSFGSLDESALITNTRLDLIN